MPLIKARKGWYLKWEEVVEEDVHQEDLVVDALLGDFLEEVVHQEVVSLVEDLDTEDQDLDHHLAIFIDQCMVAGGHDTMGMDVAVVEA